MIYEVQAAVQHIVSLVQQVDRQQPVAPEALAAFESTLKDALESRCQKCWKPAQPEAGSAHRSVAWQLHSGGEGADLAILRAFASVIQASAEEGEIVRPYQSSVVALALQWLPVAFTLWIDPGCVAIRIGTGPGANRSSYDFDHLKSGSSTSSINVIWGHMVAQPAERNAPQLTVSSAVAPSARPIAIVKPNPTTAYPRYPATLSSNAPVTHRHSRTSSNASSTSSSYQGLVRSTSLSSTHTISTDATSLSGLEADEADADSEACPSLFGSPSSSLASSQCTPSSELDRESIHDTTIGGGDTTQRFTGCRLFDDDAHDEDAGDATIDANPAMLGLNVSKDAAAVAAKLGAGFTPAKLLVSSTPVKCNYTTHDNGNVGVLGGGVRLGGAASAKGNTNSQPPRYRQHSNSKSISHIQHGFHNQIPPSHMAPPHHMPRQVHHFNAANYSAPMPTVPLPGVPHQQHNFLPRQQPAAYLQQQAPYQRYPSQGGAVSFPHASQLPTPYAFCNVPPQHATYQTYTPQTLHVDGESDEMVEHSVGRRRLRSRGRRSRGRGAGRAARRQAAALRALELGSTDELPESDDEDDDEMISRCSTPAGSEYTTSASSVYSSVASSPEKPTKSVQHRSSRNGLRGFGQQLHDQLSCLQAC
ncbi:C3HC4 finger protein [Pseudozyma hubeiensis SY62]|uniref:C3HC4 finger protein n=1 Tax=Pseudozyma hubeiensis (strain SY62) TaxID=1305764 RepID=R9NZF1_PSEHS|nr:C3HC4 finger protein [Pseudozyma hubeiensis SY62]GAC94087.1 C3HC4 finger protein [Pseudozyma hubeiensis SY62]